MVVTNGDNEYADSLFSVLLDTPVDKDIVALDYYSRYARPTAAPCERFLPDGPPCKVNRYAHAVLTSLLRPAGRPSGQGHRGAGKLQPLSASECSTLRALAAQWAALQGQQVCPCCAAAKHDAAISQTGRQLALRGLSAHQAGQRVTQEQCTRVAASAVVLHACTCGAWPPSVQLLIIATAMTMACVGSEADIVVCRMKWCHIDLGANVLRWPRLLAEDRRFGALGPVPVFFEQLNHRYRHYLDCGDVRP